MAALTHGHCGARRSPTYQSWKSMKKRCTNSKFADYHVYGGRGITVCERWQKFEHFLADMGERPAGKTLDRIDSNGHYTPQNCRWATVKEQNRNSKNAKMVTINGKTQCLAAWAEETGIPYNTISLRIRRGVPEHELLLPPSPGKRRSSERKST